MSKNILSQTNPDIEDLFSKSPENDAVNKAYEARRKSFVRTRIEKTAKVKKLTASESHQLDVLYDEAFQTNLRCLPNDFARSALFTARNNKIERRIFKREVLFHYSKNVTFVYTGIELRADTDELVFMQLLHYAAQLPLGVPFIVNISDLLNDLGWDISQKGYNRVRDCITRLKATELMVKNDASYGKSGSFSLIAKYEVTNDNNGNPLQYKFWFDPEIITFFAGGTFTTHNWEKYKKYSPVARRLCDYIKSHSHPYPLALETFMQMCGCVSRKNSWKATTKKAAQELLEGGDVKQIGFDSDGKLITVR